MPEPTSQLPGPHRVLLVFQVADRLAAIPLDNVERIAPMAELACPPGLPPALEGILNLAGEAVAVLRLDRLFALPAQQLGLYSKLVILRIPGEGKLAILVDRVSEVLPVPPDAFLPIDRKDSFNGCAEAAVSHNEDTIHVLSLSRMLVAKEREALVAFQATVQRRLQEWGMIQP